MNMIRSMLKRAGLTQGHWCCALDTAVHLINGSQTLATNGKTPHEMMHNKKPNMSNIAISGCIGVHHLDKEERQRKHPGGMSDRAERVRMLGCDDGFGTCTVRNRKNAQKRVKVDKWHQNTFKFSDFDEQLPNEQRKKRKRTKTKKRSQTETVDSSSSSESMNEEKTPRRSTRRNRNAPPLRRGFNYEMEWLQDVDGDVRA